VGRRLGQHFLHDPAILDRIVSALDPSPNDVVLEIGSGRGTLTRRLAPRVGRLLTIEKDRRLAADLRNAEGEKALPANVRLVEGDALSVDWHQLLCESAGDDSQSLSPGFKVVGNIPYAITAPLIEKALQPPQMQVAVYLIQQEVADRLAAKPGVKAYGALTVGVQSVANVERLFAVRPGSFSPPPAVDSAVVRLTPLAAPLVADSERTEFRRFVAALFGQRRKQLSRALRTVTGMGKTEVEDMLERLGIDTSVRPEVLTREEILRLFRATLR
jgi:16S rRNA (adenine1518-N6/adenine1519-N6)-dimethyltransferase